MTDLQVKYWALKEQERANRAQEELKSRSVDVEEQLGEANVQRIYKDIDKMSAEMRNLDARTDLTETQKKALKQDMWIKQIGLITKALGLDLMYDVTSSTLQGAGKAFGQGASQMLLGGTMK